MINNVRKNVQLSETKWKETIPNLDLEGLLIAIEM